MIRSMTGFGRGISLGDGREFIVEFRCVNHKFLDLNFRMPRTLSFLEDHIRQLIVQKIARGHIDVVVAYKNTRSDAKSVQVDQGVLEQYVAAAQCLTEKLNVRDDRTVMNLMRLPEVITVTEQDDDADEIKRLATQAVTEAISGVLSMREREGEHLKCDILLKLDKLDEIREALVARAPKAVAEHTAKFTERISALITPGIEVDKARLATEIAIFADKASVDEELVRIKTHISNLRLMLDSDEPIGRKADFLVQELNREFNTTGSKSTDTEIASLVIAGKAEIEKMREQIQNIE